MTVITNYIRVEIFRKLYVVQYICGLLIVLNKTFEKLTVFNLQEKVYKDFYEGSC
jgi:hypothetical protein